jgi:hypothetical protein
MNPANEAYGQDFVLATYAGLRVQLPLWGHLQHAWMLTLPSWEGEVYSTRWPTFVFSDRNLAAMRERWPQVETHAIGDPFLYVVRLLETPESRPHDSLPPSTLAYPTHADGQDETIPMHEAYRDHLRSSEQGDITVCLHPLDHHSLKLRAVYEEEGWRVIHHGSARSQMFLFAQHAEILRHGRVVTNQFGTAMLHGAALGRHVEVSGPVFGHDGPEYVEVSVNRWPAVHRGGVRGNEAKAMAWDELGGGNVREPDELAALLGWRGIRRLRPIVGSPLYFIRLRQQYRSRPLTERLLDETPGLTR